MLTGPFVFIDVDTQRDFLEPAGRLYISGSSAIRSNLARLTEYAQSKKIPILATCCAHREGDPEFERFPPHCLVGTLGQRRIRETEVPGGQTQTLETEHPRSGPLPAHLTIEKQGIDVFFDPRIDRLIDWYNQNHPLFVVYGVAADYCVKAVVEGLGVRGCRRAVVVDAVWSIDKAAESRLLADFDRGGALLTRTDVVCDG